MVAPDAVQLGQIKAGTEVVVERISDDDPALLQFFEDRGIVLAIINAEAKTDATIHVGGYVEFLEGGVHVGNRDLFVTEACEYVESFLTLRPTVALINNIDDDHLDYYDNIEAIVAAFERFLALLPEDGTFVACVDDPRVKALADKSDLNVVTYGLTGGEYNATKIEFDALGNAGFTVVRHGEALGNMRTGFYFWASSTSLE